MGLRSILRSEAWIFGLFLVAGQGCVEPWAGRVKEGPSPESGLKVRILAQPVGTESDEKGLCSLQFLNGAWRSPEPYRLPEVSQLYFAVEGEILGEGPVQDARVSFRDFLAGAKAFHSTRHLAVPLERLVQSIVSGEIQGRLDLLVGSGWKSYEIRIALDVPMPAVPVQIQSGVRGARGGKSFGMDLVAGKVEALDVQVRNTSSYPLQLLVRTYSLGEFRLTTRIDDATYGSKPTRTPRFSQVKAEVSGLKIYRSTQALPELFDRLPPDWVSILIIPGEKVHLAYSIRAFEAAVTRFDSKGRRRLYTGMRMKGWLPRDIVLATPDVTPNEVSALIQNPDGDPERVRFFTRASGHSKPILEFESRSDFITGGGISDLDWDRAAPRVQEGNGRVFDIR